MRTLLRCAAVALTLAGATLSLTGCPTDPPDPPSDGGADGGSCKRPYAGDRDAEMELELLVLDADYVAHAFKAGGSASILVPPQGGRVIFAGVRATNLDPCAVRLAGALRDPATDQVRIDTRTQNLDVTDDGWAQSDETDIATFSNIPVCSNNWASTDVFDQTFTLVVSVRDRDGKEAKIEVDVVPRCDEKKILTLDSGKQIDVQKECLCICKEGYVTGEACDTTP